VNKERKRKSERITNESTGPSRMNSLATPKLADGMDTVAVQLMYTLVKKIGSFSGKTAATVVRKSCH